MAKGPSDIGEVQQRSLLQSAYFHGLLTCPFSNFGLFYLIKKYNIHKALKKEESIHGKRAI